MKWKQKEHRDRLKQNIVKHAGAFQEAEEFLNTIDAKVERLQNQIESLHASVEPMKAKSRRASTLLAKNKRELDKLFGKVNNEEKMTRYKRKIRELEREIANG